MTARSPGSAPPVPLSGRVLKANDRVEVKANDRVKVKAIDRAGANSNSGEPRPSNRFSHAACQDRVRWNSKQCALLSCMFSLHAYSTLKNTQCPAFDAIAVLSFTHKKNLLKRKTLIVAWLQRTKTI